MKKGRGSHHTRWHESVFLYYVATSKVEDPNRNPAGFYFGHCVWEWWAFGCQRETLSRNWEAIINMNNCCSIPPQLRSLYCKCCLNAYPFTPFVSWTFIITSLLYSSGENEQYTYYRWILWFLFTMMWLLLQVIIQWHFECQFLISDALALHIGVSGTTLRQKTKTWLSKQLHKGQLVHKEKCLHCPVSFSILLPPCAIVLLIAKFSSLGNWPVDKSDYYTVISPDLVTEMSSNGSCIKYQFSIRYWFDWWWI